jgi:hypothetical protein
VGRALCEEQIMKSLLVLTVVAALCLCNGCGGDTHESLAGEAISTQKDLLATLETVKDQETAKAAKSKLQALATKMKDIEARQTKLGTPNEAQFKAIGDKYGKEMEEVQTKMVGVMMRVMLDPKIQGELIDIDIKK